MMNFMNKSMCRMHQNTLEDNSNSPWINPALSIDEDIIKFGIAMHTELFIRPPYSLEYMFPVVRHRLGVAELLA